VIENDSHMLVVLRYIEANPVRAKIVADAALYRWSSFPCHGLGHDDPLLSSFPAWNDLGGTEAERRKRWREKVRARQRGAELLSIRNSLRSGRPFGTPEWTEQIAERLKISLVPRPRGRPRKEI
jgi:putative transposase